MLLKHQTTGASLNWDGSRMLSACPCTHLWVSVYNRGVCVNDHLTENNSLLTSGPKLKITIYVNGAHTHTRAHATPGVCAPPGKKSFPFPPPLLLFRSALSSWIFLSPLRSSFAPPLPPPKPLISPSHFHASVSGCRVFGEDKAGAPCRRFTARCSLILRHEQSLMWHGPTYRNSGVWTPDLCPWALLWA